MTVEIDQTVELPGSIGFRIPSLDEIAEVIGDFNADIVERMRCLFYARSYGGEAAVKALAGGIGDPSVLLVHEVAYVMGQVGDKTAIPYLAGMLDDTTRHCMIRHEAAEALAAIGDPVSIPLVRKYVNDESAPVRETCQLALRSLEEKTNVKAPSCEHSQTNFYLYRTDVQFQTVDPVAKNNRHIKSLTVKELGAILINEEEDLYDRYEALFQLRDLNDENASEYIVRAMQDKCSALLRHEVAFVLGQIQTPSSVNALAECLGNLNEHPMARHEAALALGSVACSVRDERKYARKIAIESLLKHSRDPEPIVYQSCLVGLDNIKQETGNLVC